jgi:carbonic anhydrase
VQEAWEKGQELHIHGWIYTLSDGIVKDLNVQVDNLKKLRKFRREFLVR